VAHGVEWQTGAKKFVLSKAKGRPSGTKYLAGLQTAVVLPEDRKLLFRSIHMRRLVSSVSCLLVAGAIVLAGAGRATGQQTVDPDFDATVENPTFPQEGPKILIDEAHDNFHTASGGYKPFAELIANDGFQVSANQAKFSRNTLDGHDILVIANAMGPERRRASPAFTEQECDAVHEWVREGGSLLLIADHFPMGSAADSLGRRFGVEMSKGMTDDPAHYDEDLRDILFTRDSGRLADHPITNGRDDSERIDRVVTFTGQSLKGPEDSHPFLLLADTAVDELPPNRRKASAAGRAQGIAMQYGQGKVVVLAEAGMLTAQLDDQKRRFGMNCPGIDNRQLALNIMHWLAGVIE
jgi:hypothetical protein